MPLVLPSGVKVLELYDPQRMCYRVPCGWKCKQNFAQGEVQPKQIQGKAQIFAAAVPRVSESRVLGAPDWMDPQCVFNWCDFQRRGFFFGV